MRMRMRMGMGMWMMWSRSGYGLRECSGSLAFIAFSCTKQRTVGAGAATRRTHVYTDCIMVHRYIGMYSM